METTTERTWEEIQARFEASLARLEAAVERLQLINMDEFILDEEEE
jgi:hypothetical protein